MPEKPARPPARRLEEIFGRDLAAEDGGPEDSRSDDRAAEERLRERWYRENRPPHHDDA